MTVTDGTWLHCLSFIPKPKVFLHLHSWWTLLSSLWENVLPFQLFLRPVSEPDPSCVSFSSPGRSSEKKNKDGPSDEVRWRFTPTVVHQNKGYIMVIDGFFYTFEPARVLFLSIFGKRRRDPDCFQITASSKLQFRANNTNIVVSATSFDFPRGSGKDRWNQKEWQLNGSEDNWKRWGFTAQNSLCLS